MGAADEQRGITTMAERRAQIVPDQRLASKHARQSCFRFEVLGAVAIRGLGAAPLTRASHRRLLSILLLHVERRLTTDHLIERFWADHPPATAKAALHTHISALRQRLPARSILTEGDGYRLELGPTQLDSCEFSDLVRGSTGLANGCKWQQALHASEAAIVLWRGEPFEELADDEFAQPEIRRLNELRTTALETRAEALLRLGRAGEALPDLEWTVRQFPLREGFSTLLARARQQTGSHADALRSLRETERALADLGLEPSPALRALEQQILTHAADTDGHQRLRSA
jgi:DNA-binding SARP family transcriptional activator